ncbi:RHS repeat domain-containing protein [Streptomyces sp. NPDC004059]
MFDARDRLLEHTDALGNITRLERDDDGNRVGLIAAAVSGPLRRSMNSACPWPSPSAPVVRVATSTTRVAI